MKQLITFLSILLLYVDLILPTQVMALPAAESALDSSKPKRIALWEPGAKDSATATDKSAAENPEPTSKPNEGTLTGNTTATPQQDQKPASEPAQTTEPDAKTKAEEKSLIKNNHIILYYGFPGSKDLGILGEYSMEETAARIKKVAAEYDNLNGAKGVIPAFHILFGTVWPEGAIGIIDSGKLQKYIDYAEKNGFLVFIDHQLGKYSVEYAIGLMLPYLKYKCVHLAIDPEWHTSVPGKKIGSINGVDINIAQGLMQDYMVKNNIPDKKMLVVHQFNYTMIRGRDVVKSDYSKVDLIHNADGFGSPAVKLDSYKMNKEATNMPNKGFKLFYANPWRTWGFDKPLMTPEQVMRLDPQPVFIMYQ